VTMERARFVYGFLVGNCGPFTSRLVGNGWLSSFPISAPRLRLASARLCQCRNNIVLCCSGHSSLGPSRDIDICNNMSL
jgi:hypothetical protein